MYFTGATNKPSACPKFLGLGEEPHEAPSPEIITDICNGLSRKCLYAPDAAKSFLTKTSI